MSVATAELFLPIRQAERVNPTWREAASGLLGTYSLALVDTVQRIDDGRSHEITDSFSHAIAAKMLYAPGQDLQEERCWHTTAAAMRKPLGAFGLSLGRNEKDGNIPWQTELELVNNTTELLAQRALINTAKMMANHETTELKFAYNDAQQLMRNGDYEKAVQLLSQAISPLMTAEVEPTDRSNLEIDWGSDTHPQRAQFTVKGRKAVEELSRLNGLPLNERVIRLAKDPYLGRVLAKMDSEMAADFSDWIFAQQIVNAAGQAADTHALQITGGSGRIQRFAHRLIPSGIENPRPPKRPGKGEIILLGGTALILVTVLAACAAQDDDDSQLESTQIPPTAQTLIAGELPTIAATFAVDATPGLKLEATATPYYQGTVDSIISSLPPEITGQLIDSNVQNEVNRIAQGDPLIAAKLLIDFANLRHALFGDPEHLVALPENTKAFGISSTAGLANSGKDSEINDNQIAFLVTGGNGTPDELPVGSMIFWSNGNELQTNLSPEQARNSVLIARPLPGGTLDLRIYNNMYTLVRLDSAGNVVHYLDEARVWVDQNGNPVAEITNTPELTATPVFTATPAETATSTPEQTLDEGEVMYEFRLPDSSETISFALSEELVNILQYAEKEPGQLYNDEVPLAQARVEEQNGKRYFIYGNIIIATEINGKWVPNEVETRESYLQFTGGILAQEEDLGYIDPNTIVTPKIGVEISYNSQYVPEIGNINYKIIHNPTVFGATRTNYVVIKDGKALQTAQMQLKFAYWIPNDDGTFSMEQFSVTGNYNMGLDDGPVFLADYKPKIGDTIGGVFLIWSNNLEPGRQSAIAANSVWEMWGLPELQVSQEPQVENGTNLGLPEVLLAAIEP